VPAGAESRFRQNYAELSPEERFGAQEKVAVEKSTTVAKLAKEQGVPPVLLAAVNGVDTDASFKSGKEIVLPMDPPEGEGFYDRKNDEGPRRGRHHGRGDVVAYKVRRGDSLKTISRKTGMSIAALKRNNPDIDWSTVHKGQRLRISTAAPERSSRSAHLGRGRHGRLLAMNEKSHKGRGRSRRRHRRG
jgi:LysM repeat protein